jgi:quercetin dioxygenase-like cupin family protein
MRNSILSGDRNTTPETPAIATVSASFQPAVKSALGAVHSPTGWPVHPAENVGSQPTASRNGGTEMKTNSHRRLIASAAAVAAVALGASGGYAASRTAITQVDPAVVPTGFLVARGYIPFKVALQVGRAKPHLFTDGVQAYIQHGVIQPGQSTGWHSHAGPVWVLMVNGALTLYSGTDKTCTGHTYSAGQGFVDIGFGHIHIARNEGATPAEFYAFYMLPNQSGDTGVKRPQPNSTNPACSFAS